MSLQTLKYFSTTIPVIFLEARFDGSREVNLTQLGISIDTDQCNIAVLTRASGVILIASFGSYAMYRICSRLFGVRFLWTILESAKIDLMPYNEARQLRRNNEGRSDASGSLAVMTTYDDRGDSSLQRLNSQSFSTMPDCHKRYFELRCRGGVLCLRKKILLSRKKHGFSQHRRFRRPFRSHHVNKSCDLLNLCCYAEPDVENNKCERFHGERSVSQNSSKISSDAWSDKSASLCLLWDDPQWDEQVDFSSYDAKMQRVSSTSNVSEMSEFRGAKEVFDDECSSKSARTRDFVSNRGDNSDSMLEYHDFIEKNCMSDSKHLYQITASSLTTPNTSSVSSERSSGSFLLLRQRFNDSYMSSGLLELAEDSRLSSDLLVQSNNLPKSMTDSGISKGSSSSFCQPSIHFADGCGLDSCICSRKSVRDPVSFQEANKGAIIRRTNLKFTADDCLTPNNARFSLEWSENSRQWSTIFECPINRANPLFSCFQKSRSADDQLFSLNAKRRKRFLMAVTRDLLAWAREEFDPESSRVKVLKSLYTSKARLRRIGLRRSLNSFEHFVASLLHSMILCRLPFFTCSTISTFSEAIRYAFSRYQFIRDWNLHGDKRLISVPMLGDVKLSSSTSHSDDERYALDCLLVLWNVQQSDKLSYDDGILRSCTDALKLLTILWMLRSFEQVESGQTTSSSFYVNLFGERNPRQILQRFQSGLLDEEELTLFADALQIQLEVYDCGSSSTLENLPRVYRMPATGSSNIAPLRFLKLSNYLFPVFSV